MKYIKNQTIWLLTIMYFEFIFSFFSYANFLRSNIINIFILSFIISTILNLLTGIFNKKVNNIMKYTTLSILGIVFSLQYIFHSLFDSYFSLSVFSLSNQLNDFAGETVIIILKNIIFVILFFLPLIINIIFNKKLSLEKNKLKNYLIIIICLLVSSFSLVFDISKQKNISSSIYDLLFNINDNALNIEKMGVITSGILDINRTIFGFEEKLIIVEEEQIEGVEYNTLDLNFDKDTTNDNIIKINEYMESLSGTNKNKYTGIFKDYNLVYITAESFSEFGVSEELTPTLYKLINSGFVFKNFYNPVNLSTIGGEFQSVTGLYANNTILSKWRSGNNYFPSGLGNVFNDLDYTVKAYHNNSFSFQDRQKYLKSIGFNDYMGCYNGLEKLINCKIWPQSDTDMINATINDYVNDDKFMAYYMTVSGHFEYDFDNSMAYKHRALVKDLNYSESAKAYLATQIELDRAIESLINKLKEAGRLNKTIIVLQADHYPYALSLSDINSLSTYQRDGVVELNHSSLIIWNPNIIKTDIEKTCMSIDVIPTVYNLFGIEYDSRLFTGTDIFSDSQGLAIMNNRSWVSDYGTYYANSSKFVSNGKEIPDNYVDNMNKIVQNRMNISKLIISEDYYNYLLK